MKYLPYLPLAAAAVLAFLAAGAEEPARQEALTGWAAALVGATMALLGVRAVARGRIRVRSRIAERDENPTAFWITVILFRFGIAALFFAAAWWYLA